MELQKILDIWKGLTKQPDSLREETKHDDGCMANLRHDVRRQYCDYEFEWGSHSYRQTHQHFGAAQPYQVTIHERLHVPEERTYI